MSSVKRRLLAGFGANMYARVVATIVQIVSVPIYLTHWGTTQYGEWLLLNAIPSYFLMSNLGFGASAGNEMTMLVAAGDIEEAISVFQSVWVFITSISALCAVGVIASISFLPLDRWLQLKALTVTQGRTIILLLSLSVLFGLQEGLFQQAFRCVGKYALGTAFRGTIMMASFLAVMVVLMLGQPPEVAAAAMMLVNWGGTICLWFLLRRQIPWIRFGMKYARIQTIRRLASPSFSFMLFPLNDALSLQGTLILIGHAMGPIGVVTFSTARTISRSANQVMQLINNAVWPEMSAAFGRHDLNFARNLHRRSCQLAIFGCLLTILGASILGNRVWRIWTVGKIVTDPWLLSLLLLQMLVGAFWFTSSVVPTATNKHQFFSRLNVATTVLSLALSWLSLQIPWLELRGVAISLVLGDLIMVPFVLKQSLEILNDSFGGFFASIMSIPRLGFYRRLSTAK